MLRAVTRWWGGESRGCSVVRVSVMVGWGRLLVVISRAEWRGEVEGVWVVIWRVGFCGSVGEEGVEEEREARGEGVEVDGLSLGRWGDEVGSAPGMTADSWASVAKIDEFERWPASELVLGLVSEGSEGGGH